MCGMFCTVTVSNEIKLPHFPEEIQRDELHWQSKQGLDVYGGPYRITTEGRLEEQKSSHRDKTDQEKADEAEKWGFDSWEEYEKAYDNTDDLYPDNIDFDPDEDGYDGETPPIQPSERVIDEKWWADISHHGTFEFHQMFRRDPIETKEYESTNEDGDTIEIPEEHALDLYMEYEARFNKGDLEEIVFMGERMADGDPVEAAIEQIEEWREWKENNDN